jgi:hypothetical protein
MTIRNELIDELLSGQDPASVAKFWLRIVNELRNRGGQGHLDRCGGWVEGLSRGDQRRLSTHLGANLHPAFAAQRARLRLQAKPQASGGGIEADLPGAHG